MKEREPFPPPKEREASAERSPTVGRVLLDPAGAGRSLLSDSSRRPGTNALLNPSIRSGAGKGVCTVARFGGVAALVVAFSRRAVPARAQTTDAPDPANVRMQIGPLYLNPTIALTNLGADD